MSQVTDNTQSADRNDSTNSNAAAEIKPGTELDRAIPCDSKAASLIDDKSEVESEADPQADPQVDQQEEKIENPFDDSVIAEKYKTPHEIAIERLGTVHEHCAKLFKCSNF